MNKEVEQQIKIQRLEVMVTTLVDVLVLNQTLSVSDKNYLFKIMKGE